MLINNHHLYVEEYGPENGPKLIWLHHGLGSTLSWRGQAEVFAEKGFHVILYDRWGYGRSDVREQFSMPFFSEDIEDLDELFKLLKINHAGLVGHSDGGTIALLFAARHPELVSSLVIAAAHIYIESSMENGVQSIYKSFHSDPEFRTGLRRAHPGKGDTVFNLWYSGWTNGEHEDWNITSILWQISCPTLIIQGEADEHATLQHARDIAAHINGSILWIPKKIGHMLPQKAPDEFNEHVTNFLMSLAHPIQSLW